MNFSNLGGSTIGSISLPVSDAARGISGFSNSDEYGNAVVSVAYAGVLDYGWEGTAQREVSNAGVLLMGARVYNPTTGRFASRDLVPDGNEIAYSYPNDALNGIKEVFGLVLPAGAVVLA